MPIRRHHPVASHIGQIAPVYFGTAEWHFNSIHIID
jgi:hypothetical protein